ncbi:response regulator [Paenibacillus sp. GCM10023252]|uniref:response regulator n=1 Tax=Paenibacillus sp. GCM10023252 TaxID=3252649 RepID=UPI003622E94D
MLKMIIADDEFNVRRGLRKALEWEDLGIQLLGEAEDGEEALQLCRQHHPDLLLSDIRMPFIDGLQLASQLREEGYATRVIFISGIQDFDYVKTALSLNADGYVLKPVKLEELLEVVSKVTESIQADRDRTLIEEKLKLQLEQSLPALREKFLNQVIAGFSDNEVDLWEKASYYMIPFTRGESMCAAVIQMDNYQQAVERFTEENKQLLFFSIHNVVEEITSIHKFGICFTNHNDNEFIIVVRSSEERTVYGPSAIMEFCEDIVSSVTRYLKISVSIGIGNPVNKLTSLRTSYREAKSALQYTFYTGSNSILSIQDLRTTESISPPSPIYTAEHELLSQVKLGYEEGVTRSLHQLFDPYLQETHISVNYVRHLAAELLFSLSRMMYEMEESFDTIIAGKLEVLKGIEQARTIQELQVLLQNMFIKATMYFEKKHMTKNTRVTHKIKEIISRRYMEDINTTLLSKEVFLTPNYISQIFKQETGLTITEYITRHRIETAKNLLKSPDLKVLEISEMVGIDNPQYFSTLFKKYTGMHPGKYRSLFEGN